MRVSCTMLIITSWFFGPHVPAPAQSLVVDNTTHHLRNAEPREWSEFPRRAEDTKLKVSFVAAQNNVEYTLSFHQYDVKQYWRVTLNGETLGSLVQDEKHLYNYLKVPPGVLQQQNTLEIFTSDTMPDDIRVGSIRLHQSSLQQFLSQATVDVEVIEEESGARMPSRITIVTPDGILQPISATSDSALAVRPGYVYTVTGQVSVGLPAGAYTLYASRGFEFGVAKDTLSVMDGDHLVKLFTIRREVDTKGWVSSDTHIHTSTWSKHGDATSEERVVTIAGEGIELPIITDHNVHADLRPVATAKGVGRYFTAIPGNEVTTRVGHFNLFPVDGDEPVNHQVNSWPDLTEIVGAADSVAVILNHGRDIHLGFRPLDPLKHLAIAGTRVDDWEFPANAMEIINSGAQQTDQMQLTSDWFGLMNSGKTITPVGSSDSHDVSRFFVGQARTYIRCNDDNAGDIDVKEAIGNFLEGNVTVSFGLMTCIEINETYGPGELVPGSDEVKVSVTVSGPEWLRAERVRLFANGTEIRRETINENRAGVKWTGSWNLTVPPHDVFLVAVAEGPGEHIPFWPIAKPFQPTSPDWKPAIFGVTGAVWLDGDRNGERNSAHSYADDLVREAGSDITALIVNLSNFHESVAVQAAVLLHQKGRDLSGREISRALERGSRATRTAFENVISSLQQARKR